MENQLKYHYINRYYNHEWQIEGSLNDTIYDIYRKGNLEFENLNCKFFIYDDEFHNITIQIEQFGPFAIELDLGPNVRLTIDINVNEGIEEADLININWQSIYDTVKKNEPELNAIFSKHLKKESITGDLFLHTTNASINSFTKELMLKDNKEAFSMSLRTWKEISLNYLAKFIELKDQIKAEFKNKI